MLTVNAAALQKKFGRYRDLAQREPVAITNHGRENLVLLSADEYRRLKRRDRSALRVDDLTEDDRTAILASRTPPEAEVFNDELEENHVDG